jgi:hypothetical protein
MSKDKEANENKSPAFEVPHVEFRKDQVTWSDIKSGWNEFKYAEKKFEENSKK